MWSLANLGCCQEDGRYRQEVVFLPSPVRFLTDPLDPLPPSFGRIEMSFHPTGLPPPPQNGKGKTEETIIGDKVFLPNGGGGGGPAQFGA